jgi:hypothetical protein
VRPSTRGGFCPRVFGRRLAAMNHSQIRSPWNRRLVDRSAQRPQDAATDHARDVRRPLRDKARSPSGWITLAFWVAVVIVLSSQPPGWVAASVIGLWWVLGLLGVWNERRRRSGRRDLAVAGRQPTALTPDEPGSQTPPPRPRLRPRPPGTRRVSRQRHWPTRVARYIWTWPLNIPFVGVLVVGYTLVVAIDGGYALARWLFGLVCVLLGWGTILASRRPASEIARRRKGSKVESLFELDFPGFDLPVRAPRWLEAGAGVLLMAFGVVFAAWSAFAL